MMATTPIALAFCLLAAATTGSPAADPEGGPPTLKSYSVSALLDGGAADAIPSVGLLPLIGAAGSAAGGEALSTDAIHEILRRAMGEARFEAAGRSMTFASGGLLLSQTPENHERTRRILSLLEAAATRQAEVEVRFLEFGPGALDKLRGSVLTAAERAALLRDPGARTVAAYSASGAIGSRLSLGSTRETRILADYDVEIAQSATIADPAVETLRDGFAASVRILPCGSGAIDVEATAEIAVLDEPIRSLDLDAPALGRVDLPALDCARVAGTAAVPAGGALALVARGASGGAALAVVFTPRVGALEPAAQRDVADAPVEIRIADLGPAGIPARSFGALAARSWGDASRFDVYSGSLAEKARAGDDDDGVEAAASVTADALAAAGGESAFVRRIPGRHALVLGDAAAQSAVASAIESLLAPRRLTSELTVAVVPLTEAEAASFDSATSAEPLLAAARANREGSCLFQSALVSGDRAAMTLGREFSYVGDYEVEVAQGSKVADPQISFAFVGAAAEVRVTRGEDSARAVVEVRLVHSSGGDRVEARSGGTGEIGAIEFPSLRRSAVTRRFVADIGKSVVALVGTAEGGAPVALVVAIAEP